MDCGGNAWDWQEENGFGMDVDFDNLSYMFDETTPVKDCADLVYEAMGNGETNKESQETKELPLQVKRRRMLQFDCQATVPSFQCEELSSAFLKSVGCETYDSSEEICSELSTWISAETGDDFPDEWLSQCLTDPDISCSPDDVNNPGDSDVQENIRPDMSDIWNDLPNHENRRIPLQIARTPQKVVFKGRRSYIRTPYKLACSVAYPFAFIKPCGVQGDVTLKDINQRILTPPPSKAKKSC